MDTGYGFVAAAACTAVIGNGNRNQQYLIPVFIFFVPSFFPLCLIPRTAGLFFGGFLGSLFFVDASGNQPGYVAEYILIGSKCIVGGCKLGNIIPDFVLFKEALQLLLTYQQHVIRSTHAIFVVTVYIVIRESQFHGIQGVIGQFVVY